MHRGFLAWFGRKTDRGDGDVAIASYLAVFLAQATEGSALGHAIDAGRRGRELGEAELIEPYEARIRTRRARHLTFGGSALRGYDLEGKQRFELHRGRDTAYVQTAGR